MGAISTQNIAQAIGDDEQGTIPGKVPGSLQEIYARLEHGATTAFQANTACYFNGRHIALIVCISVTKHNSCGRNIMSQSIAGNGSQGSGQDHVPHRAGGVQDHAKGARLIRAWMFRHPEWTRNGGSR